MLKVVIPMAGMGSRFTAAGYKMPKPFINVAGIPMINRVVENLTPIEPHEFIFIARKEHETLVERYMNFPKKVIYIDEPTEGAACTVLLAEKFICPKDSLVIANCDQLIEWNDCTRVMTQQSDEAFELAHWKESNCIQDFINDNVADSSIAVFRATESKWSYAKIHKRGYIKEVAEKNPISPYATAGIYYFCRGRDFIDAAKSMIKKDIRVNGEFYVCPVFNELIQEGILVVPYHIKKMHGLGTPEDLEKYLEAHR